MHATRARHTRATQTPLTHCQRPPPDSPRQHPSMSAHNAHRRVLGQRVRWLCAGPTLSRARTLHTRTLHTHTHTRCTHAHILYTQRKRDIAPLLTRRPPPDGPRLDGQRVRWLCAGRMRALRKQTHTPRLSISHTSAHASHTHTRCTHAHILPHATQTRHSPLTHSAAPSGRPEAGRAARSLVQDGSARYASKRTLV